MSVADNQMRIMQDEVFGPVVPIMGVEDFEEGLRLANDSRYGLSAYIFTKDMRRVMRLVRELNSAKFTSIVPAEMPYTPIMPAFAKRHRRRGRQAWPGRLLPEKDDVRQLRLIARQPVFP